MEGYIVEGGPLHFLDRARKCFTKHSNEHTPFVHSLETLIEGGTWVAQATKVYPGNWDERTNLSTFKGEGIPFADFVASLSAPAAH